MTRLDSISIEDLCQRARTAGVDAAATTERRFHHLMRERP